MVNSKGTLYFKCGLKQKPTIVCNSTKDGAKDGGIAKDEAKDGGIEFVKIIL